MTGVVAGLYHRNMDNELNQLESQIEQMVALFEAGKAELRDLRLRLSALEAENRKLNGKLNLAVSKLEAVLEKLPET